MIVLANLLRNLIEYTLDNRGIVIRFFLKNPILNLVMPAVFVGQMTAGDAQVTGSPASVPQVVVTHGPSLAGRSGAVAPPIHYKWKTYVTCTIFWIGELPSGRNFTPNRKSSWDPEWSANFGGYDDPEVANRLANYATGEFRPKNFIPKLNPFYVALPYNDVLGGGRHKPEASKVIPWFGKMNPEPGKTVCKGRWVQIYNGQRMCYGQWEDCGPWVTDDWEFVFGTKPPKTAENGAAGIDLSPSIRDYLGLQSGCKVHWRFVEAAQVPDGPWKKYGQQPAPVTNQQERLTQQRYLDYLKKLRDEQFQKKSLKQAKN